MADRRTFLKQVGVGTAGLGLAPWLSACNVATLAPEPTGFLPRSSPEAQGIDSASVSAFLHAVATSGIEFHSIMVVRHGHVVAEGWWAPYRPDYRHTLYSLSKAFTSTAVGLAVADGRLTIDDAVTTFFPDRLPPNIGPNLAAMKVRHLLTMTTGHAEDTMPALRSSAASWPKAFLGLDVDFEPGTHFLYNTGASYMLSAIVQQVMGRSVHDLLTDRVFRPLGIRGSDWETDPAGVNVGGYGLRVTTEDIAKVGQFYLDRGRWAGSQILPAAWVDEATSRQTSSQGGDNDWSQGYGYQFWRCKPEPGFYRGDGAFGQFAVVIPQRNMVLAVTGESSDMQRSMNLMWDHLLPGVRSESALPARTEAAGTMARALGALTLAPAAGEASSVRAGAIGGRVFRAEENPAGVAAVRFGFDGDRCTFTVDTAAGSRSVVCGLGRWHEGDNQRFGPDDLFPVPGRTAIATKVAASAAWRDANVLVMKWQYVENVHHDDITCRFEGDRVTITFLNSAAAMQKQDDPRAPLVGVGA